MSGGVSASPTILKKPGGASKIGRGGSDVDADLTALENDKAPLVSPIFTGAPEAPTQGTGSNSGKLATTAFVQAELADLVASSPAALDTLNELAAALNDDPNFATTMTNALAAKLALAGGTMTGKLTVKDVAETVYSLAAVALDPANGTIQHKVLTSIPTFTDSLTEGESITLHLTAGVTYPPVWPVCTFIGADGDVTPVPTAEDVFVISKINSILYISHVGSTA